MKKLITIFLLALLLFHIVGYRIAFAYLEKVAAANLDFKIDANNFSEASLIEIKIPLDMPYYSDKEYEAVAGEIIYKGEHLQFVKRKVSGNHLYLMCLPNEKKNNLVACKLSIDKGYANVDKNTSQQKNPSKLILKLTHSEYFQNNFNALIFDLEKKSTTFLRTLNSKVGNLFDPLTEEQPPEVVC